MSDDVNLFGERVPPVTMYWIDPDTQVTASALRKADRELQIKAMELWFFEQL